MGLSATYGDFNHDRKIQQGMATDRAGGLYIFFFTPSDVATLFSRGEMCALTSDSSALKPKPIYNSFFTSVPCSFLTSRSGSRDESGCRYDPPTRSAQVKYCQERGG